MGFSFYTVVILLTITGDNQIITDNARHQLKIIANRLWLSLLLFLCGNGAWAHSYVDLGIENVWLDNDCHLNVAIRNSDGTLPDGFYFYGDPVVLVFNKGLLVEQTVSLTKLDTSQHLASATRPLIVKSSQVYANIPEPVTVVLEYGEEFGDFNGANDAFTRAVDCQPGKGEIDGAPIVYTHPDVAITRAVIDPQTCALQIDLTNITGIGLDAGSWLDDGVTLMIKNTESSEIIHRVALKTLDPNQQFTRSQQHLSWQSPFAIRNMADTSVAIWYVKGDNNFRNNSMTLPLPASCNLAKQTNM